MPHMTSAHDGSDDASDVWFAARLVTEGLLAKVQAESALAKSAELAIRGRALSFAEIVMRMKWATAGEIAWMRDPIHPPRDLLPGIDLGARIGSGGMAEVFAAVDATTRRPLAVKLLRPGLARNPASVDAFHREAEAAAACRHPSVVDVYYDHLHDGLHYLVMERIDGIHLREPLDAGRTFPEREALRLALGAARALRAVAAAGWVHRDVKPSNFLLDRKGALKLIDFGLAVPIGTGGGDGTAGTVTHLAPEQASGERIDPRADMFALGVTLFQWLFGKLPFDPDAAEGELLDARTIFSLKSGDLKAMAVDHRTDFLVRKMMATERELRFTSWDALVTELETMTSAAETRTDPRRSR